MPIDNPYYIKENLPKVEEIRYLNENQLTKEQEKAFAYFRERQNLIVKKSKLSPAARSKIIQRHGSDYLSERAFNHDIALMQMYGPGFWEGVGEVVKFTGKAFVGAVVTSTIVATGPFAIPIGASVAASGYCFKKAAEKDNCPVLGDIADIAVGGGIGGVGGAVMGAASSSVVSKGANLALESALTNGSEELLRVWMYTRATQMGYYLGGKTKQTLEGFASFFHGNHQSNGIKYERECPICNGNFDKFFWL